MKEALVEVLGANYQKLHQIVRRGTTWYKAKDVCLVLGLRNTSTSVRGNIRIGYFGIDPEDILKDGDWKSAPIYVSESGVLQLILKSRKPLAYLLKTILSKEVIPQIMRTGSYQGESKGVVVSVKACTG
jgi:anti-repressor protein